jgi:hypothetical protein
MNGLIIPLLWLLAGLLCVLMLAQGLQRKVDLLSTRNIYLAGFIIYQIVSPISAIGAENYFGFRIVDPEESAKWLVLFVYIYIALFLLSYHRIRLVDWLAKKFTTGATDASDSLLTGVALALAVLSLVIRVVGLQIPLIRGLSINVSVAFAAAACAISGWIWGHRKLNPVVLLIAGFVLCVGIGLSLTGFYSRRPIISMVAGFAWGAYYRWARQLKPSRLIFAMAPLVLAAIVVVGAFTAVRGSMAGGGEAKITVAQMRSANIGTGAADLLSGQATGAVMLWILEKYPHELDYNHLFSLRYMAYYFVPRTLWPDKPDTLANNIAHLARLRGVNRDVITLPPGVIGYAAAEGGFYALVVYALFFGQFTRFFDELIRRNPTNPFIILPVGCTVGQYLGLARGDISTFTNLAIIGFISTFLMLYVTRFVFGRTSSPQLASPWPQMQ